MDKKTTYSKKVELKEESQKGIEDAYRFLGSKEIFYKHSEEVKTEAEELSKKIFNKSGILANFNEINVGRRKEGRALIFFEVEVVYVPRLGRKINSMPNGLKKKQALALFELIKKEAGSKELIQVHAVGEGEVLISELKREGFL
ncbi:MAG: hypothetical protein V1494_07070 [Candidatus Diapherotrites archaeon]